MYCNTNGGGQAANPGCPAIRVVMFPKDTNPAGNIFGKHDDASPHCHRVHERGCL